MKTRVQFDGILEGRIGDATALEAVDRRLARLAPLVFDLERDGGRLNLLPGPEAHDESSLPPDWRSQLAEALRELVEGPASQGECESTLRCQVFGPERIEQTLFAVQQGRILRAVSRERARNPEDPVDAELAPAQAPLLAGNRRMAITIIVLLLCAGGLLVWQSGLWDRLVSTSVDRLECETGPFDGMLSVKVTPYWGNYQVGLTRGAQYPITTEDIDVRTKSASTAILRAAINQVAQGGEVFVRIEDSTGRVLSRSRIRLSALLTDPRRRIVVELDGHQRAARVVLGLDEGLR